MRAIKNLLKHVYITINKKRYTVLTYIHQNSAGDYYYNALSIEYYIPKVDYSKYFGAKINQYLPEIDKHFYDIKKKLEQEHPNILLVMDVPTKFANKSVVGGINVNLTIYVPPTFIKDRWKDSQISCYIDEIQFIIEDINKAIWESLKKNIKKNLL